MPCNVTEGNKQSSGEADRVCVCVCVWWWERRSKEMWQWMCNYRRQV